MGAQEHDRTLEGAGARRRAQEEGFEDGRPNGTAEERAGGGASDPAAASGRPQIDMIDRDLVRIDSR